MPHKNGAFACPFCGKTFEKEVNKNRHVGQAHRAERAALATKEISPVAVKRRRRKSHDIAEIIETAKTQISKLDAIEESILNALARNGGIMNRSDLRLATFAKEAGLSATPSNLKAALQIIVNRQPKIEYDGQTLHLKGMRTNGHRTLVADSDTMTEVDTGEVALLKSQRDHYKARCQMLSQIILRLMDVDD